MANAISIEIMVMVNDDFDLDDSLNHAILDDMANQIEVGINAVEDNVKLKFPAVFEGFDWSME